MSSTFVPPPIAGWAVGAVFFFFAWVLRVSPSVMVEELMRDFSVGGAILGQLSALYFFGYAGMQIPAGLLLDRFGPRRLMSAAALVCAAGCGLFVTDNLASVALGRFLIGVGSAFSLVGAMAVASRWYPPKRFAGLAGLAMMMGMAGGVFGQAPVRRMVELSSWRTTTVVMAGIAVGFALAAWLLVRDRSASGPQHQGMFRGLMLVLSNPQNLINAITALGATAPLLGFAALWGVPFLVARYQLPHTEAAAITSLLLVGWGIGSAFFGWWSDRIGRRRTPLLSGLVLSTAAMWLMLQAQNLPLPATAALCLLAGFGGSALIINFALMRELNPAALSGTAIGVLNAMMTGAGALFQPLIGWLLDLRWSGAMLDGSRVYTDDEFRFAFTAILVGQLMALACATQLKEPTA